MVVGEPGSRCVAQGADAVVPRERRPRRALELKLGGRSATAASRPDKLELKLKGGAKGLLFHEYNQKNGFVFFFLWRVLAFLRSFLF